MSDLAVQTGAALMAVLPVCLLAQAIPAVLRRATVGRRGGEG
jgi:hypothetical protein